MESIVNTLENIALISSILVNMCTVASMLFKSNNGRKISGRCIHRKGRIGKGRRRRRRPDRKSCVKVDKR